MTASRQAADPASMLIGDTISAARMPKVRPMIVATVERRNRPPRNDMRTWSSGHVARWSVHQRSSGPNVRETRRIAVIAICQCQVQSEMMTAPSAASASIVHGFRLFSSVAGV